MRTIIAGFLGALLLFSVPTTASSQEFDPVQETARASDPKYAALQAWVTEAPSEDELIIRYFDVIAYVGETYGKESALYAAELKRQLKFLNIVDAEGTHDALMMRLLVEAAPLVTSNLGEENDYTKYLNEELAFYLYGAGQGPWPFGLEEKTGKQQDDGPDRFHFEFKGPDGAADHERLIALIETSPGLAGLALVENRKEAAALYLKHDYAMYNFTLARTDALDELIVMGELKLAENEARNWHETNLSKRPISEELPIKSAQYLAYILRESARENEAAQVLLDVFNGPEFPVDAQEVFIPGLDLEEPIYRVPQAKGQFAELLLTTHKDTAKALDAARYSTRYLRTYRDYLNFTSIGEEQYQATFEAPDEPMGLNSANQFATLIEALWRAKDVRLEDSDSLTAEAFLAAQDALANRTTQAIARAATARAAERAGLGQLVRDRDRLELEIAELEARLEQIGYDSPEYENIDSQARRKRAEYDDIILTLSQKIPEALALIRPKSISLVEARALLSPDEAILLVVPTRYATHIFAVTSTDLVWHRSDLVESNVADLVNLLRLDLDPWGSGFGETWDGGYDFTAAYGLYRELIEPVVGGLKKQSELYYAVGPVLSSLPLTVLVSKPPISAIDRHDSLAEAAWLADRFAFSQLPSLQSLTYLRKASVDKDRQEQKAIAAFGDPILNGGAAVRGGRSGGKVGLDTLAFSQNGGAQTYRIADKSALLRLARLPGTAGELAKLQSVLGAPDDAIRLREDASETAVKQADLSGSRFVAFATHGLLAGEGRISREPGLVLTPPTIATTDDDGLLAASEILALDLSADWVILSACNTAGSDGLGGEGLSGLARSFFFAGAKSLLASHWPVRDDVAPMLTSGAVGALVNRPGMSRARALQIAMAEIRSSADIPNAGHPSAWGAFINVGDAR